MHQSSDSPPPVFIVGCPRSGTTLLSTLFRFTPWGVPYESRFIPKYAARAARIDHFSDRRKFRAFVNEILAERPIQQRSPQIDIDHLYETLDRRDYPHIAGAICRAANRNRTTWGDKTPHYILDVPLIHKMFPQAKFLCLVRDGRDVALSLMEKPWGPANIFACARFWKQCHDRQPILERLAADGLVHHVRYEDLLDTPREAAAAILRFLEIDDPDQRARTWAADVRSSNHGKWKSKMAPADIRLFGRIAGDTLRHHGYECDEPEHPPAWPRRAAYRFHNRAKHLSHLIRMNTVEEFQIRFLDKQPFAD